MMPVLFPEVTDVAVVVGVTIGIPCPVLMTVIVGTEGACVDGVITELEEAGRSTDGLEPGPVPMVPLDGSVTIVDTGATETRASTFVVG